MKRVLYLETGTTGGGSFASMLLNIIHIDRDRYVPIAVFLNETPHKREAEALGVATYLLSHPCYTRGTGFRRRLYRGVLRATGRHVPILYLTVYRLIHRRLMRTLRGIVSRHEVDIIHLNNDTFRDLFGMLVSRETGAACVSHLRTMPAHSVRTPRMTALANDLVFTYVAISGYVKEQWARCGIDASKCRVIHNGIQSLDLDAPDLRREFGFGDVQTIICSVGRLVAWKNHAFLIRGFAEYRKQNPSSVLLIVGDGPERQRLEELAGELHVAQYVFLFGHSEDAKKILKGSDIFVLGSKEEPFGRVTLEAMALKVPVVVTRSGANPEIVNHGKTGLLVTLEDAHELCAAMEALSSDPEMRQSLVENAYESTRTRFHMRKCAAAIEDIYAAT